MSFSGSYHSDDVTFLLKPVRLAPTPVAEKERLIQSGRRHYSEMISAERLPSDRYLELFHEAVGREKARFARDLLTLAKLIADRRPGEIVLASIARAGTPVGVVLARALRKHFGRRVTHYSLSVIRDRGIDEEALRHILRRHPAEAVVFLDGWAAKGVIAAELGRAVERFNRANGVALDPGLYAVADLCGAAATAATADDYLIPSCLLGATVSGLVSRSILNAEVVGPGDFHACISYHEWIDHDLSRWFADAVTAEVDRQASAPPARSPAARVAAEPGWVGRLMARHGVRDPNRLKPGVGEATRALLRRSVARLLVRDLQRPEVSHLLLLAREGGVPVVDEPALPCLAAAVIGEVTICDA